MLESLCLTGLAWQVNKIWLSLLLHHNPSLCKYRKAFLVRMQSRLEVTPVMAAMLCRLSVVQLEKKKKNLEQEVQKKLDRVEGYFVSVDPNGHGIDIPEDGSVPPELEGILTFTLNHLKIDKKKLNDEEKAEADTR